MKIAHTYGEWKKELGIKEKDFHIMEGDGDYLLLHIPTSMIFEIDRLAYDWIRAIASKNRRELLKVESEYAAKKIKEVEKEIVKLSKIKTQARRSKKEKLDVETIFLNVAQICNLKCSYCYSKDGSYGAKKGLMRFEDAKGIIDYFCKKKKRKDKFHIHFFGGEPLLNFELIKEVVSYANKMKKAKGIDRENRAASKPQTSFLAIPPSMSIMIMTGGKRARMNRPARMISMTKVWLGIREKAREN